MFHRGLVKQHHCRLFCVRCRWKRWRTGSAYEQQLVHPWAFHSDGGDHTTYAGNSPTLSPLLLLFKHKPNCCKFTSRTLMHLLQYQGILTMSLWPITGIIHYWHLEIRHLICCIQTSRRLNTASALPPFGRSDHNLFFFLQPFCNPCILRQAAITSSFRTWILKALRTVFSAQMLEYQESDNSNNTNLKRMVEYIRLH